jgi:hypothetical protein
MVLAFDHLGEKLFSSPGGSATGRFRRSYTRWRSARSCAGGEWGHAICVGRVSADVLELAASCRVRSPWLGRWVGVRPGRR